MKTTINFRNLVQVALFEEELKGQLSDGWWENSRSMDHYKPWCLAEANVNPTNLGRDFWADKDNYNFCASGLISVVGGRMLEICRRVAGQGYTHQMMMAELRDMKMIYQKEDQIMRIKQTAILKMKSDVWTCNVCGAENSKLDGECQFCECEGKDCRRDNCSDPKHFEGE